MDFDELAEIIRTRRSIRKWQDKEVPDEILRKCIDIATYAPSGGNHQMWKFYVIKNRELITKIADSVQEKTDMMAEWPEADEYVESIERWKKNSSFFRYAPVLIASAVGKYSSAADKILRARKDKDIEANKMFEARELCASRIQSISAAISYLLLGLHTNGIGSVWMTGPVQAKSDIEMLINLPDDLDFIALIAAGYPDYEPRPKKMRPLEEVLEFIK
ncbi:nitroreductase family protein [Thermoanaerobacterium sp. RBIITD]|uniref:nitroreductase family protein n=1 Tax=Thermoanaerobacterium sp. RBIITD TaxID=1550240 RepID=UPI000BB984B4|nr:nitroreductase family protein [Thermoanaerobacterium sp. RBIITD]SNX54731.1 Nitroreductase [Thermoanaerobacterium sp. RBIITD]